jgi:hypothetical protein
LRFTGGDSMANGTIEFNPEPHPEFVNLFL